MSGQKNSPNLQDILSAVAADLYDQAMRDGRVPPLKRVGRGRPGRNSRLAAMVAATVAKEGVEETARLLERKYPGQPGNKPHRDEPLSNEGMKRRVRRYVQQSREAQAGFLMPGASDEVYYAPEARRERLERLITHYVTIAYERWLRGEPRQ
ncbi:MAG: hypothetical protein ACREGK_05460 [Geminicoccales bacterium]